MSRVEPRHVDELQPSPPPSVPIGPQVLELLAVAYRARRAVLLEGPTGIGKSEIVAQFCQRERIGCRVLDLSLLEPPDLIGLPRIVDDRTHYAFPSELPTEGAGVLMLEELNRAELPVMQPALQLLSARRLHAYELPPGWTCVAAINPEHDDYAVNRLDRALRSRFLQLHVHAALDEWLAWARGAGAVDRRVVEFVAGNPEVFETSSPRSWAYAAAVLAHMTDAERERRELVLSILRGYLPLAWATALADSLTQRPADADEQPRIDLHRCFADGGAHYLEQLVAPLRDAGRTDVIARFAAELHAARPPAAFESSRWSELAAPLPGDLREALLQHVRRGDDAE